MSDHSIFQIVGIRLSQQVLYKYLFVHEKRFRDKLLEIVSEKLGQNVADEKVIKSIDVLENIQDEKDQEVKSIAYIINVSMTPLLYACDFGIDNLYIFPYTNDKTDDFILGTTLGTKVQGINFDKQGNVMSNNSLTDYRLSKAIKRTKETLEKLSFTQELKFYQLNG